MAKNIKNRTDEDKILGNPPVIEENKRINYEDKNIKYKVTNLQLDNEPTIVTGNLIETFIGSKNAQARKELKNGAKEVFTKDIFGVEIYKIEVVE